MRAQTLTPLDTEIKQYEFIAFDTEGDGSEGGFICGSTFDATGGKVFSERGQLGDSLLRRQGPASRILAANLEYDWSVTFQPFTNNHSILLYNGRWLRATYHDDAKHTITAWDIQRIAPLSVAEMGEVIGLAKYPTPPSLKHEDVDAVTEWSCETHHRLWCVECYCLRDAEIVYKFAVMFQEMLNGLGGEMKMTAASCAMDLWRRRFLKMEIAPTWPEHNLTHRKAYYGGRVENFRAGVARDIHVYDFNSLYPSVMRDLEVGLPDSYHHLERTSHLYERLGGFGVWTGTMETPSTYVPCVPTHAHGHNYYPTQTFAGSWTFAEVRYAIAHGAKLLETSEITFARHTVKPFAEFVDTLFALRQSMQAQDDQREKVIKVLLNGLAGKFGQHAESGLQTLIVPRKPYRLSQFRHCVPVELAGYECFLKPIEPQVQSAHVQVLWAAEIAAQARIKLHQALLEADNELYYCDTDSIHTTASFESGHGLGELKHERRFDTVVYYAPKEYAGIMDGGEFFGVAKGVPSTLAADYLRRGTVSFSQPTRTLETIRSGGRIAEWKQVRRVRQVNPPCRMHERLDNYALGSVNTWPYPAEVLDSL